MQADVAARLDSCIPDPVCRKLALDFFSASLRYIREQRQDWALVRFKGQRLRLFAGKLIVLTIEGNQCWLATDGRLSGSWAESLRSWRWDTQDYPTYSRPPSRNGYYRPTDDKGDERAVIETFHRRYLDEVLKRNWGPDVRTIKAHEQGVVDYLLARTSSAPEIEPQQVPYVEGDFKGDEIAEQLEKTLVLTVRREGQGMFRAKLLDAYRGKCAITGCAITEMLDAAHIHPHADSGSNEPRNGLLLRTDIHRLFDLGLLAIDPKDMTVVVAPHLQEPEYDKLAGSPVKVPKNHNLAPSERALASRLEQARRLWSG